MSAANKAAITVLAPRDEVERRWRLSASRLGSEATVRFADAPGDRGTEIHVEIDQSARGGPIGKAVKLLSGSDPLSKAKDELRRFKQMVETGVIARSEAVPEGELAERKIKARPAQPLKESELEKAGV
jgi:uncharacterized membrane protein